MSKKLNGIHGTNYMIKCLNILIIGLLISVACLTQNNPISIPNVLDVIHSRKSVRTYTGQVVSEEQIEILLRAGMSAPSAMNRQPWFFVVVDDGDILKEFSESIMYGKMLSEASVAIVVCGNMRRVYSLLPDYWVQDCSASTQNILLAAEGIGLGAVWIGIHPQKTRTKKIRKILNLPRYIVPLSIISIGYPTGVEKPKDKWAEEKIIRNRWKD